MTTTKRQTTQEEKKVFSYLNDLRESGATNMFGAVPYIQRDFKINYDEAKKYLTLWMKNFSAEGDYSEVSE